jgi:uncharacterized BrkB/YihY/UPF0761 family membrane protein
MLAVAVLYVAVDTALHAADTHPTIESTWWFRLIQIAAGVFLVTYCWSIYHFITVRPQDWWHDWDSQLLEEAYLRSIKEKGP